jgi:hypothetical protein
MFIKLTDPTHVVEKDGDYTYVDRPVYVQSEQVVALRVYARKDGGLYTEVCVGDLENCLTIKEAPEEILKLMEG